MRLQGCGIIGGQCNPPIDCTSMVENSKPAAYYVLAALKGFHAKINAAHENLQDTTIDNILALSQISTDFSAPASFNSLAAVAGLISSSLFLVGGVGGIAGVALTYASSSIA